MTTQTTSIISLIPRPKTAEQFIKAFGDCSPSSVQTYTRHLKAFDEYLSLHDIDIPLPEQPFTIDTIIHYCNWLNTHKQQALNTVQLKKKAIGWLHRITGHEHDNPLLQPQARTLQKTPQKRQRSLHNLSNHTQKKRPIQSADLKAVIDAVYKTKRRTLTRSRNLALLTVGFSSGLRASELVNLKMDDLFFSNDEKRLDITITKSKTDQHGTGQTVTICAQNNKKYCPIHRLKTWLADAKKNDGYLFTQTKPKHSVKPIDAQNVSYIIKRYGGLAGLDTRHYAGHSLRRGVLRQAVENGCSLQDIRKHARHADIASTEEYIGHATSQHPITENIMD